MIRSSGEEGGSGGAGPLCGAATSQGLGAGSEGDAEEGHEGEAPHHRPHTRHDDGEGA